MPVRTKPIILSREDRKAAKRMLYREGDEQTLTKLIEHLKANYCTLSVVVDDFLEDKSKYPHGFFNCLYFNLGKPVHAGRMYEKALTKLILVMNIIKTIKM